MKPILIPLLVGLGISCTQAPAQKLDDKQHVSRQFTLSKSATNSVLAIYNIDGFVNVEGYSGDKVIIEVDQTLSAKTNDVLEEGKKEFKLAFDQNADSVIAYIAEPYDSRPKRNWTRDDRNRRIGYHAHLEFTVKVPYAMNLNVSTVNNGEVTVKDVSGLIQANNVNGAITLTNVKGATKVHTVNGNVIVNYTALPPDQSSYHTINGDIKITYPANFSADCLFKTFQGDFFTDFANVTILPARVTKNEELKGDKTVYKLSKDSQIRIGNGGKTLRFETFNGNVYIKKQS